MNMIPSSVIDRLNVLKQEEELYKKIVDAQVGTSIPQFYNQLKSLIVNPSNINVGILARMADTDDTIASSVEFKSLMVLSKIGEYHHEDQKIKDFVNDFLKKLQRPTWQETMEGILTGQTFGFSVSEIVWGLDKELNKIPVKIPTYHPATICFEVDENGSIVEDGIIQFTSQFSVGSNPNNMFPTQRYGFRVNNPFETPFDRLQPRRVPFISNFYLVRIPRNKCIHYVYRSGQSFGSPYGKTPVRTAHLLWQLKNFFLKQMGIAGKRKAHPLLWGTAPQGQHQVSTSTPNGEQLMSPAEALMKMLSEIENDDAVVTGPETAGWKIQAVMHQIQLDGYWNTINQLNTWMFRCFLLPSLVMTDGSAGSRALGDKHFEIVDRIAESDAKNFTSTLICDLIQPAIIENFGEQDDYGTFMNRPANIEERERLSNIFMNMSNSGWMSPANKEDRAFVRSNLNLNEDTEEVFNIFKDEEDEESFDPPEKVPTKKELSRKKKALKAKDNSDLVSFKGPRIVTVGLVSNGKLLTGKRRDNGLWANPGGHMDDDDKSPEDAAVREVFEETGIKITKKQLKSIYSEKLVSHRSNKEFVVFGFIASVDEQEVTNKHDPDREFSELKWVDIDPEAEELMPEYRHAKEDCITTYLFKEKK